MDELGTKPNGEQGSPGPASGHGPVRYTRRRILVIAGAVVAAAAAVVAAVRRLGGGEPVTSLFTDVLGPFPVRSVEDVPHVPPEEWIVTVDGLVDTPLRIDHATWATLERLDETVDFHCVEGWSVDSVHWGGVAPRALLERAGLKPEGRYVTFHALGGRYLDSLPMELVAHPQTVLADALDKQPLPAKHGGPLRLVVPQQLGYKSVKWVTRLEVTAAPVRGYWEKAGYSMDAPIPG
jgi:methionine sulfoxide reductase catalytic subunit